MKKIIKYFEKALETGVGAWVVILCPVVALVAMAVGMIMMAVGNAAPIPKWGLIAAGGAIFLSMGYVWLCATMSICQMQMGGRRR